MWIVTSISIAPNWWHRLYILKHKHDVQNLALSLKSIALHLKQGSLEILVILSLLFLPYASCDMQVNFMFRLQSHLSTTFMLKESFHIF